MRQIMKMSQEELARVLQVTPRTIINWEKGYNEPRLSIKQFKDLCRILNLPVAEMPDSFITEYRHTRA
jgi:DNA-binding XRE family transcriptional regulator